MSNRVSCKINFCEKIGNYLGIIGNYWGTMGPPYHVSSLENSIGRSTMTKQSDHKNTTIRFLTHRTDRQDLLGI